MPAELVDAAISAFNTEMKVLQATLTCDTDLTGRELNATRTKIDNLVDAIADGRSSPAVLANLAELEAAAEVIKSKVDAATRPPAFVHPAVGTLIDSASRRAVRGIGRPSEPACDECCARVDRRGEAAPAAK